MALRFLIFLIGRGGVGARGGSGRGSARGGGIGRERSGLNGGVEGAGLERRGLNGVVAGSGGERRGEGFSMGYWGDGWHESKYWGDGGRESKYWGDGGQGLDWGDRDSYGKNSSSCGGGVDGKAAPGDSGDNGLQGYTGPDMSTTGRRSSGLSSSSPAGRPWISDTTEFSKENNNH